VLLSFVLKHGLLLFAFHVQHAARFALSYVSLRHR